MKKFLLLSLLFINSLIGYSQVYITFLVGREYSGYNTASVPEDIYLRNIPYCTRLADSSSIRFNYRYCNNPVGAYAAYYYKNYLVELSQINSSPINFYMVEKTTKTCNGTTLNPPTLNSVSKSLSTLQCGAGTPPNDYYIYGIFGIKEITKISRTLDTLTNFSIQLQVTDPYLKAHPQVCNNTGPNGTFGGSHTGYYQVAPINQIVVGGNVYYVVGTWENRTSLTNYRSVVGTHNDWLGRELVVRRVEVIKGKTHISNQRRFIYLRNLNVTASKVDPLCYGGNAILNFYFSDPTIIADSLKGIKLIANFYKYGTEKTKEDGDTIIVNNKTYYFTDGYTKPDLQITSSTLNITDDFFGSDKFALTAGVFKVTLKYIEPTNDTIGYPIFKTKEFRFVINQPDSVITEAQAADNFSGFNVKKAGDYARILVTKTTGGRGIFLYSFNNVNFYTLPADKILTTPNVVNQDTSINVYFKTSAGCRSTKGYITVPIKVPDTLALHLFGTHSISCDASSNGVKNDGYIQVSVTGGISPYSFTLNSQSVTPNYLGSNVYEFPNLTESYYVVSVNDNYTQTKSLPSVGLFGPTEALDLTTVGTKPKCNNGSDGSIALYPSGGNGVKGYELYKGGGLVSNPAFQGNNIINLSSGDYEVHLIDAKDCWVSDNVTILPGPPDISASVLMDDASCQTASNGAAFITPSGGTPFAGNKYRIKLDLLDADYDTTSLYENYNIPVGDYPILIFDANGCSPGIADAIHMGSVPTPLNIGYFNKTNAWCEQVMNGFATVTINGGDRACPPYIFELSGDKDETHSGITVNNDNFSDLEPGNYTITVTDTAGCIDFRDFTISYDPVKINLNPLQPSNLSCPGIIDGKITATAVNGYPSTGNYKYILFNQADEKIDSLILPEALFMNLQDGSYKVEVTDSRGCKASNTVSLTTNPSPIHFTRSDSVLQSCNGINNGSYTLQANTSGGYGIDSVYWDQLKDKNTNPFILDNMSAGNYRIKAIDSRGCVNDTIVTILNLGNEPDLVDTSIDSVACTAASNGALHVVVRQKTNASPYTFKFTLGNNTDSLVITDTTFVYQNLSNANYIFSVHDKDGCVSFDRELTIPLLKNPLVSVDFIRWDSTSCQNAKDGGVKVTALSSKPQASYKYYLFRDAVLSDSSIIDTALFTGLSAQNRYQVRIKDNYNCIYQSNEFYSGVKANSLQLVKNNLVNISCPGLNDGKVTYQRLFGTPFPSGYLVALRNIDSGTQIDSVYIPDETFSFNNVSKGRYLAKVYDNGGCSASGEFEITEPKAVDVYGEAENVADKGLAQGSILAHIANGNFKYEYEWLKVKLPSDSLIAADITPLVRLGEDTSILLSNLKAGDYKIRVRDTAHCSNGVWLEQLFSITEPMDKLQLNYAANQVKCFGENNGSIVLQGTGGWGKYRYSIDSVSFLPENIFSPLSAGLYKVYVVDSAGVVRSADVTIKQPFAELTASVDSIKDTKCYDSSDGRIYLKASGGTSPYYLSLDTITWYKDSVLCNAGFGTHTVYLKDSMNCMHMLPDIATINRPPAILLTENSITKANCNVANGAIVVKAGGGTPGYLFSWKDSKGLPVTGNDTAKNLYSGIYNLFVTDNNLCIDTFVLAVSDNTDLTITPVSITPVTCYGYSDGAATVLATLGKPEYTYQWLNGTNGTSISGVSSGTYIVGVTDAEGCKKFDTIYISTPEQITLSRTVSNPNCLGRDDGFIHATASGGSGTGYTYDWNTGRTTNFINNLAPGDYTLRVRDNNNCYNDFSFSLGYLKKIKPNLGPDVVQCTGNSYPLNAGNYFDYTWKRNNSVISGNYTSSLTVSDTGYYSVLVTDFDNCIGADTMHYAVSPNSEDAELLVSSEAMVGDTLVLIETSWPMPDSIRWVIPPKTTILDQGSFYKHVIVKDTGEYKFTVFAYRLDCFDLISKTVKVTTRDKTKQLKALEEGLIKSFKLYPNPNMGVFSVDILFSRRSDAVLRLINLSTGLAIDYRQLKYNDIFTERYNKRLSAGAYVLYLQAGNERRTISIIVQ